MLRKSIYKLLGFLTDTSWLIPGLMVCAGILGALILIEVDKSGLLADSLLQSRWLYDGGGTGARTLLGAVASSTIGVAGDTVVELVSADVRSAILRLTTDDEPSEPPPAGFWADALPVCDARRGYLQHLDQPALAAWAASRHTAIRLLVRPGDYVFPGAPIAVVKPLSEDGVEEIQEAIRSTTGLGGERTSTADLEYTIRQLVEVAVRALSPGINDPLTAISVLDRLGAFLCDIVGRHLPNGVGLRDGKTSLVVRGVDYDGLVDAMFPMIRQNAASSVAMLIRMLDVLTAVVSCEPRPDRHATLARHAKLVADDARRSIGNSSDLQDLLASLRRFEAVRSARLA